MFQSSNDILNNSKISDLESEEGPNDLVRAYLDIIDKMPKLKESKEDSCYFYKKDSILDIGYIISLPLWVLNSSNYAPYGYININNEHKSIIANGKFCGFIYNKDFYLLIYDCNKISLYSCNYINNTNNYRNIQKNNFLYEFSLNAIGENIINIQFLLNDLGKAYFIVVTNNDKLYLLNINIENKNINYYFEECKNKNSPSILAKSFSALWPFNSFMSQTQNINLSNCFIINPHKRLKKNSNLYSPQNTLYIISNNNFVLKKLSFDINNNKINSFIEATKDLSKDIINHLNSIISQYSSYSDNKELSLISIDSYFNDKIKVLFIYCFAIYNDKRFILRLVVDKSFNITFDTLDISNMITKPEINKGKIFVNNYNDEGILVIPNDIIINFNYYNEVKKDNVKGWKSCMPFKNNILGINEYNQNSIFSIDIFTLEEGIINFYPCVYYTSPNDFKGTYRIEKKDNTNIFVANFLKLQYYNINNSNNNLIISNDELINSKINKSESNDENIHSMFNNRGSLNNSMHSKMSQSVITPYEKILKNEQKNEFQKFLDEIIKNGNDKKSFVNKLNQGEQLIIYKLENYLNNEQINSKEEIIEELLEYIKNFVNTDSTHIEILDKSTIQAQLLTLEYLKEKYDKLMILYKYLKICTIEGNKLFISFPEILQNFWEYFERLIISINIKTNENIYFEKCKKGDEEEQKLIKIFLTHFYKEMENQYINRRDFNHFLLYGQLNNINDKFLKIFFESFMYVINLKDDEDINESKNDKLKYNLLIFVINIILGINNNIIKKVKELKQDNNSFTFVKYNEGLWYMSNNNYICSKYLSQIFNAINNWKKNKNNESIDNDIIFKYAEQLLFLFKDYLLLGNNSSKEKMEYMNCQKKINNILMGYDLKRTYSLAKKYLDFSTIAIIAFKNKGEYYQDIKNFMNTTLKNKIGNVKYILKNILDLEMEYIYNCKDYNKINFEFFEIFDEFSIIIKEILKNSPKMSLFYQLYLASKNIEYKGDDLISKIDNKTIISIDKAVNLIMCNKLNKDECMNNIID